MKLHSIACLLLASPLALTGQLIIDTDPAPGTYNEIRSTGTNTVNMGDGVFTTWTESYDTSTFNQSGGQSSRNNAYSSSTFNQSGGQSSRNYAFNTSTFNQSGGQSTSNHAYSTFNQSGGQSTWNYAFNSSTFNQSGGQSTWNYAYNSSTFNQSGGQSTWNVASSTSTFNLTGGTTDEFQVYLNSTINIWAKSFAGSDLQPGPSGFWSYQLEDLQPHDSTWNRALFSLTYDDGSSDSFAFFGTNSSSWMWTGTLNLYDTDFFLPSVVTPVPEPQAVGIIGLAMMFGGLWLRKRWRRNRRAVAESAQA